eukprot:scaffold90065_cov60-Phaeocystis_antarctica.AAC.3
MSSTINIAGGAHPHRETGRGIGVPPIRVGRRGRRCAVAGEAGVVAQDGGHVPVDRDRVRAVALKRAILCPLGRFARRGELQHGGLRDHALEGPLVAVRLGLRLDALHLVGGLEHTLLHDTTSSEVRV